MKKWLLALPVVLLLLILSIYIFIPGKLTISRFVLVNVAPNSAYRVLADKSKWIKWWPRPNHHSNSDGPNDSFNYNGYDFRVQKILYNAVDVSIAADTIQRHSKIFIIPFSSDSLAVKWECSFSTSYNLFKRIQQYRDARQLKNNMEILLKNLQSFLKNNENIYGFNIQPATLKDTIFITTKIHNNRISGHNGYLLTDTEIKGIHVQKGAKETNYPILNSTKTDSLHYTTMVAIPTDKELPEDKTIFNRRMIIIKDKVLTIEVKGGPATIQKAFEALQNYMTDYQLRAPGMAF